MRNWRCNFSKFKRPEQITAEGTGCAKRSALETENWSHHLVIRHCNKCVSANFEIVKLDKRKDKTTIEVLHLASERT